MGGHEDLDEWAREDHRLFLNMFSGLEAVLKDIPVAAARKEALRILKEEMEEGHKSEFQREQRPGLLAASQSAKCLWPRPGFLPEGKSHALLNEEFINYFKSYECLVWTH